MTDALSVPATRTIGKRATDTQEITVESIVATGHAMGLTEKQIALALEAIMKAEEHEPITHAMTVKEGV